MVFQMFSRNLRGICRTFRVHCYSQFFNKLENLKMDQKFEYPVARKDVSFVDNFHGTEVHDVCRWLEDPYAAETQAYVENQNRMSYKFLESCEERQKICDKITKLWNYPRYGCPRKHGKYYYTEINSGLQNQSVLYQQENLQEEPILFLNPNTLSDDGTIAVSQKSFSEDGRYLAYGLSESGSDWLKIKIKDVESKKEFDEVLEKVKFSEISWTKDNKGFFYAVSQLKKSEEYY